MVYEWTDKLYCTPTKGVACWQHGADMLYYKRGVVLERLSKDTDEFLAVRYPHIDKSWLDEINTMLGQLKAWCSGDARMSVPFSGGIPQFTEWTIKSNRKAAKRSKAS